MKNTVLTIILATFLGIGCASLPSFDVTTSDGKNFALTKDKVAYQRDGKQITCLKEADLWGCTYKDENGNIVVMKDIDIEFLEKKTNEQSK